MIITLKVQPKSEPIERRQITRLGSGRRRPIRIVNDESVLGLGKRSSDVLPGEFVRVPRETAAGRVESHVLGEGVGARDVPGRDEHVDGCWWPLNVCVVPSPGNVVADLVQLGAGKRGRGDHDNRAGGVLEIELRLSGRRGSSAVGFSYTAAICASWAVQAADVEVGCLIRGNRD